MAHSRSRSRPSRSAIAPVTTCREGIPIVTPDEALDADVVVELAGGVEGPRAWARAALDRGTPRT